MRLGVDVHVLAGKFQGSRTYLLNLYRELVARKSNEKYYFFGHWASDYPYGEDVEYVNFKSASKWKRLTYETNPLLKEFQIDLYHTTYITPLKVSCDTIVTIHDVLFETHPEYFTRQEVIRNKILVRRSAHQAKQIHTVSKYSKDQLVRLYGVPEEKIRIVPNGVDLSKFTIDDKDYSRHLIQDKYGIKDFILTVGRIEPRKNHIQLLKAYKRLKERMNDVGTLVIIGKPDFGFKEFFNKINELGLQNCVKIIDSIDDEYLPHVYRAARLFVYPTFAEGFGIPPLEAMATGVPVITSNTTAIPEIVGNAGLLISPDSEEQIADQMENVLNNPELELKMQQLGLLQSKKWSWSRAADSYIEAIEDIKVKEGSL
ncbi:glycosyltransferase family 4 protein [Paenibacillus sp. sptzw28]|uniref:glycosyltransferase family 4 protein n=1 Tax=Paenibacillus sp. sptzw28 TaxID=715179 RepID=UPI001C6E2F9A|nr:glycosyltransferase family 1 protein [Paenibacillus sp. sptzw28]QYR20625.1 glycosyltransferase family 4 protein [Paenibacillus sp. sptzw28]